MTGSLQTEANEECRTSVIHLCRYFHLLLSCLIIAELSLSDLVLLVGGGQRELIQLSCFSDMALRSFKRDNSSKN